MNTSKPCRFCEILRERSEPILYEDAEFFVVKDRFPKAPTHLQIVLKQHVETLDKMDVKQVELLGRYLAIAVQMAEKSGVKESGYRLVFNVGNDAGQGIAHVHLHLVGGRRLSWTF